jgi:hypothetical protein
MKITYLFYSFKDWSNIGKGEELLKILLSNELIIEKASQFEPIRQVFNRENFPNIWKGQGGEGQFSDCTFLFRGKEKMRFSGMASWNKNLPLGSKVVNGFYLDLNIPKNFNNNKLIQLGDELFEWSEAEYGYITEVSKEQLNIDAGNINTCISALRWVNYFGPSYIAESDFHIPDYKVCIHHGVRVTLAANPDDEKLGDSEFLNNIMKVFGAEWFWDYPQKDKKRIPLFDTSGITRQ